MKNYLLSNETLGYVTSQEQSNTDKRFLVSGSKNVQIDYQKKVKSRSGYSRLGAANTALTQNRNAWTWNTSNGFKAPQRFYDDELEVYLGTVDGQAINAWTRVLASWSTTERMRCALWWDTTENIDLQIMVIGDANLYEWNGAVATVDSIEATTITKKGTTTFAQNRFYTTRNKTLICVRTGTEYTYTSGEGTTTLTGITDTTGIIAGDILIQKIVTTSNKPVSGFTNHFIYSFENQLVIGSEDYNEIYISQNDDYDDFTFSSPRIAGEGALLNLDSPNRALSSIGSKLVIFSGKSTLYDVQYETITVGTVLCESLKIKKLDVGINQGALCQEAVVQIGNSIAYLTNEVALRIIESPDNLTGINPKTFSNPIKPDFDAEKWWDSSYKPDAFGIWYKNMLIFSLPQASHVYILNFVEDADGKLFRFWNPPQVLPVGPMSIIDLDDGNGAQLYGHSNSVPETYLLFDGASDGVYSGMEVEDKLPIEAIAIFAYDNMKNRAVLKKFDEYYVEGEITPSTTELEMELDYDYGGVGGKVKRNIDGSDYTILEGAIGYNSLAQQSLATNPLGGLLYAPSDSRKFRVIFELASEDFFERQVKFSTNDVDKYWAIISHGANDKLSPRRPNNIMK